MSDIKRTMPILYSFINEIGDTHRNLRNEVILPVEELKALMCQIVLLNARSNRANGMQMLVGMMLVGRSTQKQVCMQPILLWYYNGYYTPMGFHHYDDT